MLRVLAATLAAVACAGPALARPIHLHQSQMDQITAAALTLTLITPAVTRAPSSIALPAPLTATGLSVEQAANIAIRINATQQPAAIAISTPDH
jgi:hypothetical protein